jgi:DMSO/TMAO reductase YedYZ molybdopterin-dependent catalytic subunit
VRIRLKILLLLLSPLLVMIKNALHPQTLLAYEMNDRPLNHLHGGPLRRVENQLGFKMVKWI